MPSDPAQETRNLAFVVEHTSRDRVTIAGNVEIVLLQVKHDRARIGIIAPEGVTIARGED